MNRFLKKVVILFILISSVTLFAQDVNFGEKPKPPFQPKFTLGSGIYTLMGDGQNEDTGLLKGRAGFNAGMKFDVLNNIDLSLLFVKISFADKIQGDGFGLQFGYSVNQLFKQSKITPMLSLGVQRFRVQNDGEIVGATVVPFGLGLRMHLAERLQFDIGINFGMGMSDIDMLKENNAAGNTDGYKSLNFTIHYDLFTPNKDADDEYFDDSYYADVDFAKLESEDEDGDLVPDMDDYCPKTPIGVHVDENGCPLDDDKDGIANYLDQQKNTPKGSIVDENGVRLTVEKYRDVYSDLDISSRKYANFYNEVEIKRENYKTIDEYLIAKANAFNKAFNESLDDDIEVSALIYKVKIAESKDRIPAVIANKLLSLDDLESFTMDDDVVIYAVGSYATIEEAMSRMFAVEEEGFDDTYIIVDNNGELSSYVPPVPEPKIDEQEVVELVNEELENNDVKRIVVAMDEPINETTYRIQIGAFNKPLSDKIFVGVDNVISFIGKDGLIRYMTGSFSEYKKAVAYQAQMKARGFEDAFIVTYKNGERISLNVAIKTRDNNSIVEEKELVEEQKVNEGALDLRFTVQIMVAEGSVSALDLKRMSKLDNIDKQAQGSDMYEYYAGVYSTLEEANIQLEAAKLAGFSDAFVFATKDGERITLEKAELLLKE